MMARKPDVMLKELMATIGHASPVAALRYQHATERRGREPRSAGSNNHLRDARGMLSSLLTGKVPLSREAASGIEPL